MKKMMCNQLGGACDMEFVGSTFEEIAMQSKKHGMEMFQKGDKAHIEAMQKMQADMRTPEDMAAWMADKVALFNSL